MSALRHLARRFKFTSGKWLISVPWEESDQVWKILTKAFVGDKLPEGIRFIKVVLSFALLQLNFDKLAFDANLDFV